VQPQQAFSQGENGECGYTRPACRLAFLLETLNKIGGKIQGCYEKFERLDCIMPQLGTKNCAGFSEKISTYLLDSEKKLP
jgi:hypothetical protein